MSTSWTTPRRWFGRIRRRALPTEPAHEESRMSGSSDETKGRVKQAIGDLTGDKDMKRSGRVDELAGKAKKLIDSLKDRLTKNR